MRTVSINKYLKLRIMRGRTVEGLTVRDSVTSPLTVGHAKVPAEVPEDSRVFIVVYILWFPTSDCLETWLVPSGTTRSRQYHESTMV